MGKREIIIAISGFMAAVVLGGAGLWWHNTSRKDKVDFGRASLHDDSDNSGLGVTNSAGAHDLGQLGGNQTKSSSGNSSGNSSSNAETPSTATFAQYDKYKDSPSGLFGDIQVGSGTELTNSHKAAVYYKGWLTNGTLFDQSPTGSDGKLQPFVFTLGAHQVIPGWEQAISGMKVGGKRLMIVPPAVGYGAQGQGPIPPNAVLVFEVQLLEVQ